VTFEVIHKALDDLEVVAGQMFTLLNAGHFIYDPPGLVPSGWRLPLMKPIFEPRPVPRTGRQ